MPETFLQDFRVGSAPHQQGHVRVPQIVEPDFELLEDPTAGTSEVGRPPRFAVGAEAEVEKGATFSYTLTTGRPGLSRPSTRRGDVDAGAK